MPLAGPVGSRLKPQLRRETQGEVLFDAFSRGRYSTDASIYQTEPLGVVVPRNSEDAAAAIAPTPRGNGYRRRWSPKP